MTLNNELFKQHICENNKTRTETFIKQLLNNTYECIICYSLIRNEVAVWACDVCYQIYHLYCIKKWSNASNIDGNEWTCPNCQNINKTRPNKYTCFCGKVVNPMFNRHNIPHSCGNLCKRSLKNCNHNCLNLCHPGECAMCEVIVSKTCYCGQIKYQVKCSSEKIVNCNRICSKLLNCGVHRCKQKCHRGKCLDCCIDVEFKCHSHAKIKLVKCDGNSKFYNCEDICNKALNCKSHKCQKQCHNGTCDPCFLLPDRVKSCPCGKTLIPKSQRKFCTDIIPLCNQICGKKLNCSENSQEAHFCQQKCHYGECNIKLCKHEVEIKCRCGSECKRILCQETDNYNQNPFLCIKLCKKKKTCGLHKCNEKCCNKIEHTCAIICKRILNCRIHKCEQQCHKGSCSNCLIANFDEWRCDCGKTIVYPPIRCGRILPDCSHSCARQHDCEHPLMHNCHRNTICPPCPYLTSKMCTGEHIMRHNIPCYVKDISCGQQCQKRLPCGKHICLKKCHKGACLIDGEVCNQPCKIKRPICNHECMSPCHSCVEKCPNTVCKFEIDTKCECGLRMKKIICNQKYYDSYSSLIFNNLASEIKEMLEKNTIQLKKFHNEELVKKKLVLECNEECFTVKRNTDFAEALKIEPLKTTLEPYYKLNATNSTVRVDAIKKKSCNSVQTLTELFKQSSKHLPIPHTLKKIVDLSSVDSTK